MVRIDVFIIPQFFIFALGRNRLLHRQAIFRLINSAWKILSIPARKTSSCFSLGHFHFIQMPSAGIEPAFQPSQGRVLSIERQGRYLKLQSSGDDGDKRFLNLFFFQILQKIPSYLLRVGVAQQYYGVGGKCFF